MEKIDLTRQFAQRLRDAMLDAGLHSERSTSGVCIHKLAEITGHSVQICRRYLRGEAIPEPAKLAEIAKRLDISPGWLLFGDNPAPDTAPVQDIAISKTLMHYIFTRAAELYHSPLADHEVANFLLDLVKDISQINATEDQSLQIIDLTIASIRHFHP
ncbi:helix-turn-helix domain-containing protein [Legionella dresdenensis]|uniref:Helix-turn-helix domain-containing protein n=1 Tax=Legionella dresdenensis TaxID=450200 RepID=A0ABV8CEV8_9GAMM